jgi:hypothetical protein
MRFMSAVKWLLALAGLWSIAWLAIVAYLFSQEDYAPRRGSPAYYVGISELIRDAPVVAPAADPAYFGSVGDGGKPPLSEVSYETGEKSAQRLWSAIELHLEKRGFGRLADAAPAQLADGEQRVREAEYAAASGEQVAVLLSWMAEAKRYKVRITHFE